METKHCILTTCAGYTIEQIRPFIESCRRVFDGRIYLLHAQLSEDTLAYLAARNVTLVESPSRVSSPTDFQLTRYGIFDRYLRDVELDGLVFITDIRDVVFQSDPFRYGGEFKIKVFLEEKRIGECPVNTKWIRSGYGQDAADRLAKKDVICSGTTLGTGAGMREYLARMSGECSSIASKFGGSGAPVGIDQAVHNVLIYGNGIENVSLIENQTGEVQTMHNQKEFRFDGSGRILNKDGRVCPVLHQYDRHPFILKVLEQRDVLDELLSVRKIPGFLFSRSKVARHLARLLFARKPARNRSLQDVAAILKD